MKNIKIYNEINISEINYNKPEKIGNSYFGSISYGNELKPLYIQTPKIKLKSISKDTKNPYLECEIPEGKYDFFNFIIELDDKNIKKTFNQSMEWFHKALPLEAIDDMYNRMTKPVKRNQNPILRFKLPFIKNQIHCGIYNQNRVYIDIDDLHEGMELILIIHIRGLKILKQNYYCDNYISQVKAFVNQDIKYNILPQYSIINDKDEDDNNEIIYDNIFNQEIIESDIKKENIKKEDIKKEDIKKEDINEGENEEDINEDENEEDINEGENEVKCDLDENEDIIEKRNQLRSEIKLKQIELELLENN